MAGPAPLALLDGPAGTLPALLGTFALLSAGYALTAHVAARYVLGPTPLSRALPVGASLAAVSLALQAYGFLVVAAVGLAVDFAVIHLAYRVRYATAALVTAVHYAVTVLLGVALAQVLSLWFASPG